MRNRLHYAIPAQQAPFHMEMIEALIKGEDYTCSFYNRIVPKEEILAATRLYISKLEEAYDINSDQFYDLSAALRPFLPR